MSLNLHSLPKSAWRGEGLTSQRSRDRLAGVLQDEGIEHQGVLEAIRHMPRHFFIGEALASRAYENSALPIGYGQTISQPFIVARMSEALLNFGAHQNVLEIGTGSGYQAAILSKLVARVCTVERIEPLLRMARRRFRQLGLTNIRSKYADGCFGWPEQGSYDGIILTAAGEGIPQALGDQLRLGGVIVAPIGDQHKQRLVCVRKQRNGALESHDLGSVSFVPLLHGVR